MSTHPFFYLVSVPRKEYKPYKDPHQDDLEKLLIFHGGFVIFNVETPTANCSLEFSIGYGWGMKVAEVNVISIT